MESSFKIKKKRVCFLIRKFSDINIQDIEVLQFEKLTTRKFFEIMRLCKAFLKLSEVRLLSFPKLFRLSKSCLLG